MIFRNWYDEKDYENQGENATCTPCNQNLSQTSKAFCLEACGDCGDRGERAMKLDGVKGAALTSISHRWEQMWETNPKSQMSQISCSELCGPLMLLAVGFEYVPHSCFRVSKTIKMCTYDSCLLDHPSRDSYLMWTSHTQQVVSLAQTSPWCFFPLTVIAKDGSKGAWTFKNPWEANTSSSCVFKQLWSFSATPSRGSGSQRT